MEDRADLSEAQALVYDDANAGEIEGSALLLRTSKRLRRLPEHGKQDNQGPIHGSGQPRRTACQQIGHGGAGDAVEQEGALQNSG